MVEAWTWGESSTSGGIPVDKNLLCGEKSTKGRPVPFLFQRTHRPVVFTPFFPGPGGSDRTPHREEHHFRCLVRVMPFRQASLP